VLVRETIRTYLENYTKHAYASCGKMQSFGMFHLVVHINTGISCPVHIPRYSFHSLSYQISNTSVPLQTPWSLELDSNVSGTYCLHSRWRQYVSKRKYWCVILNVIISPTAMIWDFIALKTSDLIRNNILGNSTDRILITNFDALIIICS